MIIHSRTSKLGQNLSLTPHLKQLSSCGSQQEDALDSMVNTDIDCEDSEEVERINSWSRLKAQEGRSCCKFMSRLSSTCSIMTRLSRQSNPRWQPQGEGPLRTTLSKSQVTPTKGEPMDNDLDPESSISAGDFEIVQKFATGSHSNLSIGITQRCHTTDAHRC